MKKKVLVVENDREILELITYILEEEGYQVLALHNAVNILQEVETHRPDVVILDIIVPGVLDTEYCKTLKRNSRMKHIKLIVISTNPKVTGTIKEICADDVISKPFDISELLSVINNQLAA